MLAQHDDHFLLSFRKDVSFLGKVALKHYLQQIPDGATLIVDATRADFVDHDVRELLDTFVADAPRARASQSKCGVKLEAQARARAAGRCGARLRSSLQRAALRAASTSSRHHKSKSPRFAWHRAF